MKTKEYRGEVINDCDFIYAVAKSYREATDTSTKFHKSKYQLLSKIVDIIDYQNIIFQPKEVLMEKLNINDVGNLSRSFRQVSDYLHVESSRDNKDIPVGWLRIEINPSYGWRANNRKSRESAINEFNMFRDLSLASRTDITLTPFYKAIVENEELRKELVAL